MNMFSRTLAFLNRRYDRLGWLSQLVILVALVLPGIIMVNGGCAIRNGNVLILGLLWFAFLICSRMAWLKAPKS